MSPPVADGVFISCVSDEFEKASSPFAGLRSAIALYLAKAKCDVRVQEFFPQSAVDMVENLSGEVRHVGE